jgi:hypothetical protein
VLLTSTENALALANKIERDLKLQIREILTAIRVGIFYGKPLAESQARLVETSDFEPFEVYRPTKHMSFCIECGVHLVLLDCARGREQSEMK